MNNLADARQVADGGIINITFVAEYADSRPLTTGNRRGNKSHYLDCLGYGFDLLGRGFVMHDYEHLFSPVRRRSGQTLYLDNALRYILNI